MNRSPIEPDDVRRQNAALLAFAVVTALVIAASSIFIGGLAYLTNHGH
jgi:hypothetical protein